MIPMPALLEDYPPSEAMVCAFEQELLAPTVTMPLPTLPIATNGHAALSPVPHDPDAQYAANLAMLRQRKPEILAEMAQFPILNLQMGRLPDGAWAGQIWDVATQQYVPLCHGEDPAGGAARDAAQVYNREIKVFTLIGLGLGYFPVALAKLLQPWQRMVIFDLDCCMFRAAMHTTDLTPLFPHAGQARIDIYLGDQIASRVVEGWYLELDAKEKLCLSLPLRTGYTGIARKAEYDILYNKCMEMLVFHAVGLATWRQFGPCIGDNDLLNLPEYYQSPGYEHLKDLWKDKPAICVAAGPSLQKNLRLLLDPAIRSRVVVICAGTVYALLQGFGIQPDIVTTIDFQRLNWTDQFQYIPLDPDCTLVYLHSTYPQTVRRWPGPRFVAENASDTVNVFRAFGEGKKGAGQVQTVAHLNLLVALELGASPICLLGQDLSMPLDMHHAAGARAQDQAPNEVAPEAFVDTVDFEGNPVKSRHSFLSMKTVFERIIGQHPDATILNCSEAGLALAGAQNVPLATVCDAIRAQDVPTSIRPMLHTVWRDYMPTISEELLPTLHAIQTEVERVATMARSVSRFYLEMGADTASTQAWLMQHEAVLNESPRAWGLFAIRDFGILELLGAVPSEEAMSDDPLLRGKVNAQRMVRLCGMIVRQVPIVRRLLRLTTRRIGVLRHWICLQPVAQHVADVQALPVLALQADAQDRPSLGTRVDVRRLPSLRPQRVSALQHYTLCREILCDDMLPSMRTYAKYLYDTQQYEAALTVLRTWGRNPRRQARLQRHLTRYRHSVAAAMPRYFQEAGAFSPP